MFFSLGVDGTIQAVAVLWTLAGIVLYASEDSRHSLSPCESFVFKWYSLVRVASDGQSKVLLQLPHILHRGHGRPLGHLMGTGWTPVKCQGEFSQPPAHKSPFCWPCDVLHFTVPFETKDSTSHEETTMAPWCFMASFHLLVSGWPWRAPSRLVDVQWKGPRPTTSDTSVEPIGFPVLNGTWVTWVTCSDQQN